MTQVITVVPPATPTITNPPADTITISCAQALTFNPGNLNYTNNESGLCLLQGSIVPVIDGTFDECGGTFSVVWSVSLNCGMTIGFTQVVMVEPSLQAVFTTLPSDLTMTCDEAQNYVVPSLNYSNSEGGACEISGSVAGILTGTFDECGGDLSVTWSFTDDCDRTISHAISIEVLPAALPSCLLYTSPSPRDGLLSRMPSSA